MDFIGLHVSSSRDLEQEIDWGNERSRRDFLFDLKALTAARLSQ